VSSALRRSPSARCVIAANEIWNILDIFGLFWGHLFDFLRQLDDRLYLVLFCSHFIVLCIYFIICADCVIGYFSCWVSTLKYRTKLNYYYYY
jgi:hypothetical protein